MHFEISKQIGVFMARNLPVEQSACFIGRSIVLLKLKTGLLVSLHWFHAVIGRGVITGNSSN